MTRTFLKTYAFRTICLAVFVAFWVRAQEAPLPKCSRFEGLSAERQISILSGNDRSHPECTAYLIRHLGELKAIAALPVIVTYLDFEWPKRRPDEVIVFDRSPPPMFRFPAATAILDFYQQAAVPAIVDFLTTGKATTLARSNGRETLMRLYIEDPTPAVAALAQAARASQDASARSRLLEDAAWVSNRCQGWRGTTPASCRAALRR